jgi:hypothetical protein
MATNKEEKKRRRRENNIKSRGLVVLPYIQGTSESVQRIMKKYSISMHSHETPYNSKMHVSPP